MAPTAMQRAVGTLEAEFTGSAGRTMLKRLHQAGCAKLRLPRPVPRAQAREAVSINTSGGLTGGDRISQAYRLDDGAALTVTTQACERIYRASGGEARVSTTFRIGDEAALAYLPQETILFDGGAMARRLEADIAPSGRALFCESLLLGREMMGETVSTGRLRDDWRIRLDGRLIFADALRFGEAIETQRQARAGLAGHRAFATVLLVSPDAEIFADRARAIVGVHGGVSRMEHCLVARILAPGGYELRKVLMPLLSLLASEPLPRLWSF